MNVLLLGEIKFFPVKAVKKSLKLSINLTSMIWESLQIVKIMHGGWEEAALVVPRHDADMSHSTCVWYTLLHYCCEFPWISLELKDNRKFRANNMRISVNQQHPGSIKSKSLSNKWTLGSDASAFCLDVSTNNIILSTQESTLQILILRTAPGLSTQIFLKFYLWNINHIFMYTNTTEHPNELF